MVVLQEETQARFQIGEGVCQSQDRGRLQRARPDGKKAEQIVIEDRRVLMRKEEEGVLAMMHLGRRMSGRGLRVEGVLEQAISCRL